MLRLSVQNDKVGYSGDTIPCLGQKLRKSLPSIPFLKLGVGKGTMALCPTPFLEPEYDNRISRHVQVTRAHSCQALFSVTSTG